MPLSPHELTALGHVVRNSELARDLKKDMVARMADWLEASQGRKFRRPEWCALALGPVAAFRPSPVAARDTNGISHYPPDPKARLFRAYESPENLGL